MSEFEDQRIPSEERRSFWKILLVSLGLTSVYINMIVGDILGKTMGAMSWLLAITVGGIILAFVAGFTSWYSSNTGHTFALQMKEIFGFHGSRVISAFIGLIILGWYTIRASFLSNEISQYLGLSDVQSSLVFFLIPCIIACTAVMGFRALTIVSAISVPAIFCLAVVAAFTTASRKSVSPTGELEWSQGLTIVMGVWMLGAVATVGDITRYAKTRASAVIAGITAFLLGNTGLMAAGAWFGAQYGTGNLSELLSLAGLPLLGLVLLSANIWSTNDNSMYSVALNWSHTANVSYTYLVIVAALISATVSLYEPYQSEALSQWLTALGTVVPPLGGAIIGYRLRKNLESSTLLAWASVVAGIAVSIVDPLSLAPVFGLVTPILVYYLVTPYYLFLSE